MSEYELTLLKEPDQAQQSDDIELEPVGEEPFNQALDNIADLEEPLQQQPQSPTPAAASSKPKASYLPCTCCGKKVKRPSRAQCCCLGIVIGLLLVVGGLLIWRAVMGAKFGKVDEADAHLTFDSPTNGQAKYALRPALNSSSIKILVWNLKKEELDGMETDLPEQSQDRDLLLISEGLLNDRGRTIFDSLLGVHWEMGVAFTYKRDNNAPTGTMIGSHVMPTWVKVQQTVDHEPIINTPKCMTFAKYPMSNGSIQTNSSSSSSSSPTNSTSLLVISIHGINAVSVDALDRQLEQAASEIRVHDGPVIFGGDFNTNLATKVSHLRSLASDLSMTEVQFPNGDERKKVLGQIIDYIFIRGLSVVDQTADILANLTSSDHKAMKVELQLS